MHRKCTSRPICVPTKLGIQEGGGGGIMALDGTTACGQAVEGSGGEEGSLRALDGVTEHNLWTCWGGRGRRGGIRALSDGVTEHSMLTCC